MYIFQFNKNSRACYVLIILILWMQRYPVSAVKEVSLQCGEREARDR